MTTVRFFRTKPTPDGESLPVGGTLRFTPTRKRVVEHVEGPAETILPIGFTAQVPSDTGRLDVDLAPTEPGWVWEIYSYGFGVTSTFEYVIVPDRTEPIDEDKLVRISKDTLDPEREPDPAWWAELESAKALGSQVQQAKTHAVVAASDAGAARDQAQSAQAAAQQAAETIGGSVSGAQQAAQDAAQAKDGAVTAANTATQAADEATQAADTATSVAGIAGNLSDRLTGVEAVAGLTAEAPVDGQTANLIQQPDTLTNAALSAAFATSGEHRSKAKPNGLDQTAIVQAELDALHDAGGGTLIIPSSAFGPVPIKVSKLTLKNDGATPAKQPSIIIRGQGAHWSGRGTVPVGGSILEFTGTDPYGLLKTNGLGLLRIFDVTFQNKGASTTPFIYTTNTTVQIRNTSFVGSKAGINCDQDAIVLGGTQQIESQNGWDHGFQGYGTVISENFFSGIRTVVKGQAFANAVVVRDNTVWTTCGNPNGAAIEWNGKPTTGTQFAAGNVIEGNLIELPNYKYGISLVKCTAFTLAANNFYDPTATTVAGIHVDSTSQYNTIHEGMPPLGKQSIVDEGVGTKIYATSQGSYSKQGPTVFDDNNYPVIMRRAVVNARGDQFYVQPNETAPDASSMFSVRRSAAEVDGPGIRAFEIFQHGRIYCRGAQAGNVNNYALDGTLMSGFSGAGRIWFAGGAGGPMTWDTGTGGSTATIKAANLQLTDHTGAKYVRLASAQPTDASLANGEVGIYWNKVAGTLEYRGKDSAGTVIQKTIATL